MKRGQAATHPLPIVYPEPAGGAALCRRKPAAAPAQVGLEGGQLNAAISRAQLISTSCQKPTGLGSQLGRARPFVNPGIASVRTPSITTS